MQLIEREFAIKLSVGGVGKYLARWGFTPQKPIRRAYEQRPEAVQAWLIPNCIQQNRYYTPWHYLKPFSPVIVGCFRGPQREERSATGDFSVVV